MQLPDVIQNEQELDELLSRPGAALVDFMRRLDGDIMVVGAGGKIGPTLTCLAARAVEAVGVDKKVIAVDRAQMPGLKAAGIETICCDLSDPAAVDALPKAANIVYMAGRKFGSTGAEHLTWAANVILPYHVARAFTGSRIAVFSTGCVYPLVAVADGGCDENTSPAPVGEYAISCLGRERVFDHFAETAGEKVVHIRLSYAIEMRYGVLVDVAESVHDERPIDLTTAWANVIWQGDACNQALLALGHAASPAAILNVTGPETISIREVAEKFGELSGKQPVFAGQDSGRAFLSDSSRATALFGVPSVPLDRVIQWTAKWIGGGGRLLGKPTHFETQDGKY